MSSRPRGALQALLRREAAGPDEVPVSAPGHEALLRLVRPVLTTRSDLALLVLDGLLVVMAYSLVLVVRFDGGVPDRYVDALRYFLPLTAVLHVLVNWAWGLYGQMWRHASVEEARRILLSGATTTAALLVVFGPARPEPLSVLVLGAAASTLLFGAVRFHSRLFAFRRGAGPRERRVLVVGAGDSGATIIRDMLRSEESTLLPVALLDDHVRTHGRTVHGVPVVGPTTDLVAAAHRFHAAEVLLAIPSARGPTVRRIAGLAEAAGLPLKVLPSVRELVDGHVSVRDVRDLNIDDLLGRAQVHTDLASVEQLLTGRRVLVTGAGGSIGSEIVRQVAACHPARLLLLDHDETHLFEVASQLDEPAVELLADVRDRAVVDDMFDRERPEVVFHAAAHKHVPLLERFASEAILTNVIGTANVADAAERVGVDRFVFVSTDKAVQPRSVMGASKRVAELITLTRRDSRFCVVRFGNVLGSRGSVVPLFVRQIQDGGPLTVTDERMTRYFMSIPEAVQLVLQSAVFANDHEIFMLDMGEPVRIVELAERMIRLSGRRVGEDVRIEFTGIRPGEKLHEELHVPRDEPTHPTPHPSIVALGFPGTSRGALGRSVRRLAAVALTNDQQACAEALHDVVQLHSGGRRGHATDGIDLAREVPSSMTIAK